MKKNKRNKNIITVLISALAAVLCFMAVALVLPDGGDAEPFVSEAVAEEASVTTAVKVFESTTEKIVTSTDKSADKTTAATTKKTADKTTTKKSSENNSDSERIIINPNQSAWNLVVVNMSREMPAGYKPTLKEIFSTGCYMDARVAPYYEEMYNSAKKDGITLTPYSGYRSYERQERNYKNLTEKYMSQYGLSRKEAAKKAATVILPPGTSEHNLGLAMDICNTKNSFANTKEYKWLTKNAHKYGFILRYTGDKMHITGIVDEPWHWRFVGVEYAEDIKNSGLCLEEYLQMKGIKF